MSVVSKRPALNIISVIRMTSPFSTSVNFHSHLSGDAETAASDVASVSLAFSEAALRDWIPVDSRLRAMRLTASCKVDSRRSDRRNLFAVLA